MNPTQTPHRFRQLAAHERPPLELLLLADPDETVINRYLPTCKLYLLEVNQRVAGVCALQPLTATTAEVKNLAVAEELQHQGWGRQLLEYTLQQATRQGFVKVRVGTGNSSLSQLAFYQKRGFEIVGVERNFFLTHYSEPIWENGIPCKHLLLLEKELG